MIRRSFNPAPLGLLGFGMTTILLNLLNAGFLDQSSMGMILSMGIFYGGLAQIIAGLYEAKQGNTFGATAFISYGFFWLSLVSISVLPTLGFFDPVSPQAVGVYLLIWGVFTAVMSLATLHTNRALQLIFTSLTLLFFILALADLTGIGVLKTIGGYEGILCGASAVYLATAEILNETYNRVILPIGQKPTTIMYPDGERIEIPIQRVLREID